MTRRVFGNIPGFPEGSRFDSRADLSRAGVHRPLQAGISGSGLDAADSIVLSGGYEDDEDYGDIIIYTGHGGRDPETGKQVSHQELRRGNLALARNRVLGVPVRVIRGATHRSDHSPEYGYRYDGLYIVEDCWRDEGRSEYDVWRYRLVKQPEQSSLRRVAEESGEYSVAPRQETTIQRIVRDTEQTRQIKALYDYTCQVCGVRLETLAGPYAEAAHIRPFGAPHNGPDSADNILCLCPNDHVLFDTGGIAVADDFSLIGAEGFLRVHPRHQISKEHLGYHREHYSRR